MEAQDFFYAVASIALIVITAFVAFFFFVLYKLNKMAKSGFQSLSWTARDIQSSFGSMANSWGKSAMLGIALRVIRTLIFRR
jgi:hypothetical protein